MEERKCLYCRKIFQTDIPGKKYCCRKCSVKYRRHRMNRKALEENLGRRIKVRLFDGAEYEGYLRKSGDERYRNDPNLYLPKNYYFLTDDYGVCKTCLFRVSHIQNYKILA